MDPFLLPFINLQIFRAANKLHRVHLHQWPWNRCDHRWKTGGQVSRRTEIWKMEYFLQGDELITESIYPDVYSTVNVHAI